MYILLPTFNLNDNGNDCFVFLEIIIYIKYKMPRNLQPLIIQLSNYTKI